MLLLCGRITRKSNDNNYQTELILEKKNQCGFPFDTMSRYLSSAIDWLDTGRVSSVVRSSSRFAVGRPGFKSWSGHTKDTKWCLLPSCLVLDIWEVEHAELPVDLPTSVAITAIADVWPRVKET